MQHVPVVNLMVLIVGAPQPGFPREKKNDKSNAIKWGSGSLGADSAGFSQVQLRNESDDKQFMDVRVAF